MPEALFNTLQEDKPIEWTESEIKDYIATRGEFNSGRIAYLLKNDFTNTSTSINTSTIKTPISASLATNPTPQPILPTQPTSSIQPTLSNQGFGKELINLIKMYIEDNKYNGEDDNFNFKFIIFYDLYSKANVP